MSHINSFLHERSDIRNLYQTLSLEMGIFPQIIEKDYWLMHCLWGLKEQGFGLELKGGTSLSKGWGIIDRFSEDVDIKISTPDVTKLPVGKNHDKTSHIKARADYFDKLAQKIVISGIKKVKRDTAFDDGKMRGAGIRLIYDSAFEPLLGVKEGILLEVGFDITTPNKPRTISSWMMDKAHTVALSVLDNRAYKILCYFPEYTFVEKLQTISTKFRNFESKNVLPKNFIRHYYDVFKLLEQDRVKKFIGTPEYLSHKKERFAASDEPDLSKNQAFLLSNDKTRNLFKSEYQKTRNLYFKGQPDFEDILKKITKHLGDL
ncbi:MAG: hypothetical protein A3G32_08565 [Deltaproteobacteria bacterium RIFCSPLOWO2_12_FULL_40_28]|nr:MAG: hypothetical protein A3C45_01265 [Deltaproteobacteria bacterium RIFCSPHIGHO2_02_FULL_40_28]OGQ20956.1 MAG: hypothetical protein A3E27_03930 [Deltaproteobacteria bacterium RIFCSPHIGHO2_12_FULL_40_32]OGQ39357.1 MAG: hypothetical protein A3I69_05290 [Deltaproteobacteria bacterium RIFCSPLOWO2_02_FULL_40_36]OGQ54638.1 MAG: hypothetical protein A3G32_08565 [Deltaproteobacteria bacterium RIFCSPLOWO2_12_FULL_40_28]